MAEYYPLLAKAVGSLPNSTPDTRRIVYERARKALIGQLRTLHPPVPDEDIERESVALDRAIERLEGELAAAPPSTPPTPPPPKASTTPTAPPSDVPKPIKPPAPPATAGAVAKKPPAPPLRPRVPKPKDAPPPAPLDETEKPGPESKPVEAKTNDVTLVPPAPPRSPRSMEGESIEAEPVDAEPLLASSDKAAKPGAGDNGAKPRLDTQRPIAPQPQAATGAKPRIWIIPAGIVVVLALVALAAWKLRDRPETLARNKPVEQTQGDTGKIADRVGGSQANGQENAPEPPAAATPDDTTPKKPEQPETPRAAAPPTQPAPAGPAPAQTPPPQPAPAATNPEVPVAYRAALLVETLDTPEKFDTYLGTVVWKLNKVNGDADDPVGLVVEADIDIPTAGVKVVVTIEKNADASLPASHVIKVRFNVQPGGAIADIKRLSVPLMRQEDVQTGMPLAGVSVPVMQNSFLVGLTPGNSETANLTLLNEREWMDFPILLENGKIAKLTIDKGLSGQRDIAAALNAWQKH